MAHMTGHDHEHEHRMRHPHAQGHTMLVRHSHGHLHTSSKIDGVHRPHHHSAAQVSDLRRQQRES